MVLTGATLIDGTGRPPVPEAVIVIDGDKFTAVGGKGTKYPPDATVINLAGKFVIPGLVDSHTHSRAFCGELYLNHGVTSIFILNPWGANGNTVELARASQQPAVRSPRFFGIADRFPLAPNMTREQVREQFNEWIAKKPDFAVLPSYNERNKQAYQWAAELMHEAGLFVFGHTEDAPASNRAGQDGIEHLWGYAQALMTPEELHRLSDRQASALGHVPSRQNTRRSADQRITRARRLSQSHSGLRAGLPEQSRAQA
jgi:hypothetical protein